MKSFQKFTQAILILALLFITSTSEARIGGGGSMGSRGSRGFAPRSSRSYYNPSAGRSLGGNPGYQRPSAPSSPFSNPLSNGGGSSFMRNMLGGVAGGFLGSMLFRGVSQGGGMGMPGTGIGGSGGIGFFEILLLGGLLFFLYRYFTSRKSTVSQPSAAFEERFYPNSAPQENEESVGTEQSYAETLQRSNMDFNLNRFKEDRTDEFLKIESAWNGRDLNPVNHLITPALKQDLLSDIDNLKRSRLINKLENIAVRGSELTDSWQEEGKEFATLEFRAQLLDYTIHEDSQNLVSGDKNQTVKFQEEWTFVRELQSPDSSWKLSAISNA